MEDVIRVDGPNSSVLALCDVKTHLRVPEDDTTEDEYIETLIRAAEEYAQTTCKRAMMAQSFEMYLSEFPDGVIRLPFPPLLEVTAVSYYDSEGDLQTLMEDVDFIVNTASTPARIALHPDRASWPVTQKREMAVKIEFLAGHDEARLVPDRVKSAMYLLIGDLYENREASIVGTITSDNKTVARLLATWKLPEAH